MGTPTSTASEGRYARGRSTPLPTLPGFHVETKRHGELGDTVTSDVTIATDSLPIVAADATVATVFEGRKVRAICGVFTPETLRKMGEAMQAAES